MAIDQTQRHYPRYETDVKVTIRNPYELKTEVDFKVDREGRQNDDHSYVGISKNISVMGLCFESQKELKPSDHLLIELHLPDDKESINMEGEVRWCRVSEVTPSTPKRFMTGVLIKKVGDIGVDDTVHFDEEYHVAWSDLLERVLGRFAKNHRKHDKPS